MRRRTFIAVLGGAAAWPLVARAREMPRIAVLLNFTEKSGQPLLSVFLQEIRRLGWIDGETAHIDIQTVGQLSSSILILLPPCLFAFSKLGVPFGQ
jgi:hypothetical protein